MNSPWVVLTQEAQLLSAGLQFSIFQYTFLQGELNLINIQSNQDYLDILNKLQSF